MLTNSTFGPGALATPSNFITAIRVVVTPILMYGVAKHGSTWVAFIIWTLLASTDKIDGMLARHQGTTRSGAFLDPLADKLMVFGLFAVLVSRNEIWWVPIFVMAVRETWMSFYRSLLGRKGISVPARPLGKAKTFVQVVAIGLVLIPGVYGNAKMEIAALVWLATLLALVSGYFYYVDGRIRNAG
ncbi:MAG: CDP-alcohol phosphatidyltransferase family protein [Acidimicrobiaceae bacterium]|nr:CDP-alcohol phosphatidyltransferase family protein [Acidimicrobiaceae bacterium]